MFCGHNVQALSHCPVEYKCFQVTKYMSRVEEEIQSPMKKYLSFLVLVLVILGLINLNEVYGAGECGKSSPDREAWKLAPCITATQDGNASVSDRCCSQIKRLGQNPACLCAVMLSNTAKSAGVKPEIAVTIPKRCNIVDRPVGYKCGGYSLP